MSQHLIICLVMVILVVMTEFQMGAGLSTTAKQKKPAAKQSAPLLLPGNSNVIPFGQSSPEYFFPPQIQYQQFEDLYHGYPYPPDPPRRSSNRSLFPILLFLIWNFLNTTPAPTTVPNTTTTQVEICDWTPWSTCTSACSGNRYRTRTCNGKTQTESETCSSHQTGFLPDGLWYRASNCYDYRWVDDSIIYQQAVTACSDMGAQLASTGLRNDDVRSEIFLSFAVSPLSLPTLTYVGITDQSVPGVYVWSDGYIGYPTFWEDLQPGLTAERCQFVRVGNPWSLNDALCTLAIGYLCERKSQ